MNGRQAPLPTRGSHEQHQASNAPQHGHWNLLLVGCIAVVVVLALALFIGSTLSDFVNLRQPCTAAAAACLAHGQLAPGDLRRLHELGLSRDSYAIYKIVIVSLSALGYWLVAGLLFWRRSDDPLALLAAVSLALFPIVFNDGLINRLPFPWWLPAHVLSVLGFLCLVLLGYVFPSGHFVPSFTRWVAVVALLFWGFDAFFPSASNPFSLSQVCGGLIFLGLIGGIIVAQLYRYQRLSGPVQRQQTRWVVYGVTVGWGGYLVLFTVSLFFPALFLTGSPGNMIKLTAAYGLVLLPPLAIGLALLRFRLWEIDLLINRTLAAFSVTLRHEVELDQVSEALLAVVQETMQPAHISLWLRPTAPERQREQREQKQVIQGAFSQYTSADVVEVTTSHGAKE